ncbi:MAG TPA: ABC transporter permease [Streptosporangiaceae bacterium]
MAPLARLLLRRALGIAILAWATTAATFALLRVGIPNPGIDAALSRQLGPGQPAVEQYFRYLEHLLHGNLGQSLVQPVSVNTILGQAIPPTLSLLVGGMVLWLAAGVLAGAVSALRPGSWTDRAVTAGVLAALSIPSFLLALLLLAVFAHLAQAGNLWLQPGYVGISQSPGQWLGRMILPWIAIAAGQAGVTARLTRVGILEVLGEDYIRTARAKGLAARRILWFHALRAAVLPVVSSVGVGFGAILGGAAVIDEVFALGGIGQAFLVATKAGDMLVVTATVLATVILVALVNLIADLCYALLDPQVRIT